MMISNYLAANMEKISPKPDVIVVFDSELHADGCTGATTNCICTIYTTPIRRYYPIDRSLIKMEKIREIKQCKGEAELAQVDWLLSAHGKLQPGKTIASVLSSGEINAVPVHLFVVSLHWPRSKD
jgi:hypothetical protein